MDIPEVQVSGIDGAQTSQTPSNTQPGPSTQAPDVPTNESQGANTAGNEGNPGESQDITLPDAVTEAEPAPAEEPAAPKRKSGFQFLE